MIIQGVSSTTTTVTVASGAEITASNIYLRQNNVSNFTGNYNQTGGTVNVSGSFVLGNATVGGATSDVSNVSVTGGTLTVNTLQMYKWANCNFTLSGPAVVNASTVFTRWDSNPTGTFNLGDGITFSGGTSINDGGTSGIFNVGSFTMSGTGSLQTGTYTLNFKGGMLKASTGGASWLPAGYFSGGATVQDAGGIIDNGGNAITIAQVLSHGGVAATDGGLVFQGNGTTTLSAGNSWNGGTTIKQGALWVTNASALGTGNVTDDASLVYNLTGAYSVTNDISGTGTVSNTGATGAVTFAKSITLTNNNFTFNTVGGSVSTGANFSVGTGTGSISSVTPSGQGFGILGTNSFSATGAGSITISGSTSSAAGGNRGLNLNGANLTTAGTINLNGTITGEWGIGIDGAGATIHATSGTTTLTGTTTNNGTGKSGFEFISNPTITLTADPGAKIVLQGGAATGTSNSVFNSYNDGTVFNTTGNVQFIAGATSATNSFWGRQSSLNAGTPTFNVGANSTLLLDGGVTSMTNGLKIGSMGVNSAVTVQGSGSGTMSGTMVLTNSTDTLTYDISGSITQSGAISGAGSVTKIGSGTLELTNTHSYSGPTNVTGGSLVLNGSIANSSLTTIGDGTNPATLRGTGTTGALTIAANATHQPGNSPGVTTVMGNYTENGTLVIEIAGTGNGIAGDMTNGFSQVKVLSGGSVALGGTSSLSVIYTGAGFSPSFGQVYTIIDNDGDTYGDTTGTFGNYLSEGMTAITIGTTPLKLYYHDGGGTDQNNVVLVASNIAAPNGSTLYVNNQWTTNQVVNGDLETNTNQAFVDITAFASPSALLADQPSLTGYVVVNGGSYASAPLAGGGDVQLRLVNDTVNGEPNVVLGNLTGDNGDGIVLSYHNGSGGNLTVQQGNFAGTLSEVGVGTLTKTTTGTLTLGGSNSYTGDTFIQGGVLEITANNALGTNAAGTTVSNNATLQLTGVNYTTAEALTLNGQGAAANTGALYVNGTTNTFAGAITLASNATIGVWNSGTLTLTGGIDKNGHNVTFQGNGITNTANINTVGISGAADLIVDNMTVNLNTANSYVGPTVIQNGGVLNANVASALPTGTYSPVTITGATSRLNVVADQTAASLTGNGIVDNAGAAGNRVLTLEASSGSTTFSGVIQNTGAGTLALVKNGGSTQVLTGNNTYTGTTTVTGGSLHLAGGGLENSNISVTGGTLLQTAGTNHVTGSGPSSGNLTVNGGVYHLAGGTLDFQDYSAGGASTWTPAANEASTISLTTGADFEFTGGTLLDVSNIVTTGSLGTFTQNGGSFIIGQDGVGPAALTTLNGGFSLVDGVVRFDAFGVDPTPEVCCDGVASLNDQLTVTGDATLDSVVNIDFVGFTPVFGDVFTLICANNIAIGDNFSLTGGYFRVVPTGLGPGQPQYALQAIVPEPASVAIWTLLGVVGAAGAWRRRKWRTLRTACP